MAVGIFDRALEGSRQFADRILGEIVRRFGNLDLEEAGTNTAAIVYKGK